MFAVGESFPHPHHEARVARYRANRKLFTGQHYDVFERQNNRMSQTQRDIVYLTVNLPGLICKKSADFLFGENAQYSSGTKADSPEQKALERIGADNNLGITNYELALGAAVRGDSFYKLRWGQEHGGLLPANIDPFRVFVEAQNPEYVFPETSPTDAKRIMVFHVAYPVVVPDTADQEWILNVESHYPGKIIYHQHRMKPERVGENCEIQSWRIYATMDGSTEVNTGVPFPLIIHVPNYGLDDSWEGFDDLSELKPLLDELNNRLSLISVILDKHSDPAMAIPSGLMDTDEDGRPMFHVGRDKVFEIMGKDEIIPQYIVWNGQLESAFSEVNLLVEQILTLAEIPSVALGKDNSGTSGASGLSIKWRMNSLLSKVNRKRAYFERALKQVMLVAQLLEHAHGRPDYKITPPKITFMDGLPDDEMENASIMNLRTGGQATLSQKTAIMRLDGLTAEQADAELERIKDETETVDASIFNKEPGAEDPPQDKTDDEAGTDPPEGAPDGGD
jgi:hypothetical protein